MYVPETEKGLVVAVLPIMAPRREYTRYLDMMVSDSYSLRPDLELILKASDRQSSFHLCVSGQFP